MTSLVTPSRPEAARARLNSLLRLPAKLWMAALMTLSLAVVHQTASAQNPCVGDVTPPTVICGSGSITVFLGGDGTAGIDASTIENTPGFSATDACGYTLTLNNTLFDCGDVGNSGLTVEVIATDLAGNAASPCIFSVNVVDDVAPTLTIPANASFTCTPPNPLPMATAFDACQSTAPVVSVTTSTSTTGNVTTITRTFTASDNNGNTATGTQTLTVSDTGNPVIELDPVGFATTQSLECDNAILQIPTFVLSDDCSDPADIGLSDVQNSTQGSLVSQPNFYQYTITRTYTATDEAGNTSTLVLTGNVDDTTAPVFDAASIGTTELVSTSSSTSCQALYVRDLRNDVTDNCAPFTELDVMFEILDANGSIVVSEQSLFINQTLDAGVYTVRLTASDVRGLSSTYSYTLEVTDLDDPSIICASGNQIVSLPNSGTLVFADMPISQALASASDQCGAVTISYSPASVDCGDVTPVGGTPIQVMATATDASGNTNTCGPIMVVVVDNSAPDAICVAQLDAYVDGSGQVILLPEDISLQSLANTDGCNPTWEIRKETGSFGASTTLNCQDVNPIDVILQITDENGNMAQCTTVVSILDTIAPSAVCQPIDRFLGFLGGYELTASDIDQLAQLSTTGGSSDGCSAVTATVTPNVFDCSTLDLDSLAANGRDTVDLEVIVSDASGNTDTCETYIVLREINQPNFSCFNRSLPFDNSGNVTVSGTDFVAGTVFLSSAQGDGETSFSYTAAQASDVSFGYGINSSDPDFTFGYRISGGTTNDTTLLFQPGSTGSSSGTASFILLAGQTLTVYVDDNFTTAANGSGGEAFIFSLSTALRSTSGNGPARPLTEAEILPFAGQGATFYADATALCGPLTYEVSLDGVDFFPSVTLNCQGPSNTTNLSQTVTVRVTDLAGNFQDCTPTVTLLDEAPPSVVCVAQFATPGQNGTVTLDAATFADPARSSDFCGTILEYQFVDQFNQPLDPTNPGQLTLGCADVGVINVTIAGIDAAGNMGVCNTTLTLSDTEAPTFMNFPPDLAIDCSSPGGSSSSATGLPTANDNCDGPVSVTELDQIVPAMPGDPFCYRIVRRFEAVDGNGNVARRLQNIDVIDNEAPEFALITEPGYFPMDTLVECDSIPMPLIGISDNCTPAASVMIERQSFDDRFLVVNGVRTIQFTPGESRFYNYNINRTFIATDDCGNMSSKLQTVRVRDTQVPRYTGSLNGDPAGVNQYDTDNGMCSAMLTFDITGELSDCADEQFLDVTYNTSVNGPGTGTVVTEQFQTGLHTVSFRLEDPSGNDTTYVFNVEVLDTESPTMNCETDITLTLSNRGEAILDPTDVDIASYDACGIMSYSLSQTRFTCADLGGPTSVLLTATDNAGNSNTCTVNVTVELASAPVFAAGTAQNITIDCSDDINDLSLTGQPTLSSDCPSAATVTFADDTVSGAGNCRTVERTFTATVTATGQTSTFVQTINVVDSEAPTIGNAPILSERVRTMDFCMATPMATLVALDNCNAELDTSLNTTTRGIDTAQCSFYQYTVTRRFQAIDDCGNSSTFVLLQDNITDNEAPDDSAMPATFTYSADATCSASFTINLLDFIEDCAADDRFLTVTNNSPSLGYGIGSGGATIQGMRGVGSDVINYTATDPCGNTETGSITIIVEDDTAPQAACDDVILPLGANGIANLTPAMVNENSNDNCSAMADLSYSVTPSQFTAAGQYAVVLSVTDEAGNTATCNSTVFVTAPLTVSAGTAFGATGTTQDLPITVDNFTSVAQISGIVTLDDPTVATFTGGATPNQLFLLGGASPFNFTVAPTGDTLRYNYLAAPNTTTSLPSNAPLFTAEVTLLGASGSSTPAKVGGDSRTVFEATQVFNNTPLPTTPTVGNDGLVSITGTGVMATISGRLTSWSTANDPSILGADVGYFNPAMSLNSSVPTGTNGMYTFSVPAGEEITVRPSKNSFARNGVGALDVAILRQYLLFAPNITLDLPYQRIAADADDNGVLTGNDLLDIQAVAMGASLAFRNNSSWRFHPAGQTFAFTPGGIDVPNYVEETDLGVVTIDQGDVDFVGVKIGDLVGDADPAQLRQIGTTGAYRGTAPIQFVTSDREVASGELVEVVFESASFNDVLAYQFTLGVTDAELVAVEAGALANMSASNFFIADAQTLTSLWDNQNLVDVDDNTHAFTLQFVAERAGRVSEFVELTSEVIADVAYTYGQQPKGVELVFASPVNTSGAQADDFMLSQNRPNPFNGETQIDFSLPQAERVLFTITDATGRVVVKRQLDGTQGWQTLTVSGQDLPTSGVYHYSIVTGTTFATRTLTLAR